MGIILSFSLFSLTLASGLLYITLCSCILLYPSLSVSFTWWTVTFCQRPFQSLLRWSWDFLKLINFHLISNDIPLPCCPSAITHSILPMPLSLASMREPLHSHTYSRLTTLTSPYAGTSNLHRTRGLLSHWCQWKPCIWSHGSLHVYSLVFALFFGALGVQ